MRGVIDAAGESWVGVLIIVIGMSVMGALVTDIQLEMAANHSAQMISTHGTYDATEQEAVANYLQKNHISADVSVTCDTADADVMSLGDNFTIKLTPNPLKIGAGGGIGYVLVPISASADGVSGVYRK